MLCNMPWSDVTLFCCVICPGVMSLSFIVCDTPTSDVTVPLYNGTSDVTVFIVICARVMSLSSFIYYFTHEWCHSVLWLRCTGVMSLCFVITLHRSDVTLFHRLRCHSVPVSVTLHRSDVTLFHCLLIYIRVMSLCFIVSYFAHEWCRSVPLSVKPMEEVEEMYEDPDASKVVVNCILSLPLCVPVYTFELFAICMLKAKGNEDLFL